MPVFNVLIISAVVGSILFFSLTLGRVFAYNKKYHLPELSYTKLFRFITKRHVLVVYFIFVAAHAVFATWFLLTL